MTDLASSMSSASSPDPDRMAPSERLDEIGRLDAAAILRRLIRERQAADLVQTGLPSQTERPCGVAVVEEAPHG